MKSLEDVVWARACCDSDQSIEDMSCWGCPYESLNKGGLECERQLVKDEKIYLKKYLNDIQKGEIRKEVKNKWGQWEIAGHLGRYEPICGSCGRVINRDHKYCPYCGAKIKWTKLKLS